MKRISLLFIILLLIPTAIATEYSFEFQSNENLETIDNCIAYFDTYNAVQNRYLYPDQPTIMDLNPTSDYFNIFINCKDTPGFDYFNELNKNTLSTEETNLILMNSAATVKGVVKDKNGKLVHGADLKFDCPNMHPTTAVPEKTDEFGSFFVEAISAGMCRISASYSTTSNSVSVDIKRGDLIDTTIPLDFEFKAKSDTILYLLLILLVVSLVVIFFLVKISIPKTPKKDYKENIKRIEHIMETLDKNQKAVIHLLYEEHTHILPQAKVRHALGIPRTTLSRILFSLESKKLITLEKHGKAVKISLTDWILEKE